MSGFCLRIRRLAVAERAFSLLSARCALTWPSCCQSLRLAKRLPKTAVQHLLGSQLLGNPGVIPDHGQPEPGLPVLFVSRVEREQWQSGQPVESGCSSRSSLDGGWPAAGSTYICYTRTDGWFARPSTDSASRVAKLNTMILLSLSCTDCRRRAPFLLPMTWVRNTTPSRSCIPAIA